MWLPMKPAPPVTIAIGELLIVRTPWVFLAIGVMGVNKQFHGKPLITDA